MKKISSIRWVLVSLLILVSFQSLMAAKPNVIVILVDDQGYYDLSCYGADEVNTKNIDQLASEGIRFTDYYAAAPICSPSRAGLLTGSYPRRIGMETWVQRADSQIGLHRDERTLGELFHANGYKTACIGKWHLGDYESFRPLQQGFDHYFGLMHNLDPVEIVYYEKEGGVPLIRNGEVIKRPADPAELTKIYTDEAIDFIKKNKEEPFFIYLPHTMLHNPLGVSKEFKGSSKWGEYGDAIQEMDYNVGRIMSCLKEEKLDKNTVVVYASDNGRGPGRNENQPIQGSKLSTFEGGIRVPCIVWAPGLGVKPQVSKEITHAMDLLPTLATLAGITVPQDRMIDGRDISPLLRGQCSKISELKNHKTLNSSLINLRPWNPPGEWASIVTREEYQSAFFYHGSQGALAAVRSGNLKLYLNPTLKIFDLEKDPGETKPIRNKRLRSLRGMAIMFQNEMREYARPAGKSEVKEYDEKEVFKIQQSELAAIESHENLTYANYGDRKLQLDLYKPKIAAGTLPAIICIHGGGWAKGKRQSFRNIAKKYAANGFVAVSVEYRLSGEAKFPANIRDCKAAVRWLRANAARYNIDKDKIAATGSSAGGHLAALLATSGGVKELEGQGGNADFSSSINVAVPMGAQTDFLSKRIIDISESKEIYQAFLGGPYSTHSENYKKASPLTYLDAHDPPILFISGETDDPSTRAVKFRSKMKQLNIPSNYRMIRGAPHSFLKSKSWFEDAFRSSLNFFRIHLK
ncbi:MAG: sulfatase-like hydrolase/transferase [Lentisphaeraceae bacterium]|nr:sulfatase-like hydrolase/transferase [Lentisphaeraceae bacterium]